MAGTRTVRIGYQVDPDATIQHVDVEVPEQPGPGGKLVPGWVTDEWATRKVNEIVGVQPSYVDLEVVG
jgi:hypothetical protein